MVRLATKVRMRIAQVTSLQESVPPANKNGLEQVVYYLTEELVKMGHEVTLFGTADSKTSAKLVPIWPKAVSRDGIDSGLSDEIYAMWSVAEAFCRQDEFEVIHDHTWLLAGMFAGAIKTPVVTTIHHPVSVDRMSLEVNFRSRFPKEYWPYLDRIGAKFERVQTVVVSEFQKATLGKPCRVVHNGVPTDVWKYAPEGGDYLAFLGYVTQTKGAAEAVAAVLPTAERLKIAGPIAGSDRESQAYFDQKIKPHLSDRIEYVGPLDHAQKMRFLAGAKATLLPIQWDEPFGMVAIESMACGTPVIAWNRAAMPEIVVDGQTGFLVDSVEDMTEKIAQIPRLSRLEVRKRVEEHFSARKMAEEYVKVYEEAIARRKGD